MYMIALLVNDFGEYERIARSQISDRLRNRIKDLYSDGYVLVECLYTTDTKLYHKKRLQVELFMLREYCKTSQELVDRVELPVVKMETLQLVESYQGMLMRRVARAVRHCLLEDVEVTDELAIQCYDIRERQLQGI